MPGQLAQIRVPIDQDAFERLQNAGVAVLATMSTGVAIG